MNDILFEKDGICFSYRVGAVIIHDNSVLMVKNENNPYYYSVGGGVKFGETSEDAVLREIYEETNISLEIDRLAFIHENFCKADFMDNIPFQELRLFYLMKISGEIKNIRCNSSGMDGSCESLHWLPIDRLSDYHLYPEFYKTELCCISHEVKHFVTKNGNTVRVK